MEKEIIEKREGIFPARSRVFPLIDDPYHCIEKYQIKPRPEDYDDLREWQLDFDEWYRSHPGNCPNFAGHF